MSNTTDPNTGVKYRNITGSFLRNYTLIIYARATTGSTSYGEPFFEFLQTTNTFQRILNVTRFNSTTPITLIISNSGAIANTGVTLNTDHLYIITLYIFPTGASFKYTLYRYTTASQTVTQLYQTSQGSAINSDNFNQFWLGRSSIYSKYLSGQYNKVGLYYGDTTQNNPTVLLRDYVASADGNIFSGDKYVFYAQHNFMGVFTQTFSSPQVNNNRILLSSTNYMNILGIYANASSAPANFAATITPSSTSITLNWNFPTNNGGDSNSSNYKYNITCRNSTTLVLIDSKQISTTSTQFSNLTFGTSYIFEIIARNISDISSSSAITYGTPYTVPNAPIIGTAIAGPGSRQATVTWTASTYNGGSDIIGYKILAHTEGLNSFVLGATTSTGIINDLTVPNGYFFRVVAVNAAGDSQPSEETSPAIFGNIIPNAPTDVIADVSGFSGQANVRWTAPVSNNGTDISSYTVISSPAGGFPTYNFEARTAIVDSLTNGTGYTFTVIATNVVGASPASIASTPAVIPYTVPSAPTLTAVAGNGLVDLSWNAPSSNGRDISSYVIQTSPDSIAWTTDSSTNATTRFKQITGLTNGTLYYFRVYAINLAGNGLLSNVANATPNVIPNAPTNLTGTAHQMLEGQFNLSWDAPTSNGGTYISSYNVISSPADGSLTINFAERTATVTSLTIGTVYTFTVTATNAAGTSAASNAIEVTPDAKPGPPSNITGTAANAQANLSWNAPTYDISSNITSYIINIFPAIPANGIVTINFATRTATVTGLTNGTAYNFLVRAVSASGLIGFSPREIQVIPFTVPSEPQDLSHITLDDIVDLSWNAPLTTGGKDISSYIIERSTNISPEWEIDSSTNASTRFKRVTGLINGTVYFFRVKARNLAGNSLSSNVVSATYIATVPNPIESIALVLSNDRVDLSWNAPFNGGSNIIDYPHNVFIVSSNTLIVTNVSPVTFISASGLGDLNGQELRVSISARNSVGNSTPTDVYFISFTVPAQITSIIAIPGDSFVDLSWNAPYNRGRDISSYIIQTSTDTSSWTDSSTNGSTTFKRVTGLTNGTLYYFRVYAVNIAGNGPYSDNVSSTPFQTEVLFTFDDTENVVGGKLYINHNYTQQDISFNWYSSIDNSFTNPVLLSNINNKKYLFIRFEYQNLYIRCIVNYNSNTFTSSSVLIQEKYDPEFFDYNINVYTVGQKQSLFNTASFYYPDVNTPPVFNIDLSLNKVSSFLSLNRSLTIGSNLSVSTYGFESSWKPFGERLLEIVAIKIFGHPKARAAIANDNSFYDIEQLSIKVYDAFNNHRNEFGNYYMGIYDITEPNNNTQFINVSNFNIIFPFYLKGITHKKSIQLFKNGPNVGGSLLVNGEYNIPLLLTFI